MSLFKLKKDLAKTKGISKKDIDIAMELWEEYKQNSYRKNGIRLSNKILASRSGCSVEKVIESTNRLATKGFILKMERDSKYAVYWFMGKYDIN